MTHHTGYSVPLSARGASNDQLRTPRRSGPGPSDPSGRGACGISSTLLGGIFAVVSLGIGGSSHAADTTTASQGLEEIVVTAQKREERLIDVPQSVTALSANSLAKIGATQFSDFANTVPGISFTTEGAGRNQISMRGITTGFDVSPTVGIYIDDVPIGASTKFSGGAQLSLDVALFDLNRIEVLRGPQGTLYGASSMGGLIKYVTAQPDSSKSAGAIQAGVSKAGHGGGISHNLASVVNLPLAPGKAALRVSAYESHIGGYIDNVALNENNVNRATTLGARFDLLLTPVDALDIRITGFAQNIKRHGDATADYTLAGAKPYGSLGQFRPYPDGERFTDKFRMVSGKIAYDFGPVTLASISAYQKDLVTNVWDLSATNFPALCAFQGATCRALGLPARTQLNKFTQEVRLAADGGRFIEWRIGGFFNNEKSSVFNYFKMYSPTGQPVPNNLYELDLPSRFREIAAFGDVTLHVTDKFDVTGGIRYAYDEQDFQQFGSGLIAQTRPAEHSTESVLTYSANARYRFASNLVGYLRYATGYRPGGANNLRIDLVTGLPIGQAIFESDDLKSYEVGFKAETDDRRYAFDIAAYYNDWRNIQISVVQNGLPGLINAPGGVTVKGVEMTLTARPISRFIMTGTFAYQDAYMNEANADLGADKGERQPNVPRFTVSLNADYEFMEEGLQPTVGATVRHVSNRSVSFDDSTSYPQYRLPKYTLVDARASVLIGATKVQLFVHNIFDVRAQYSVLAPAFGNRVGVSPPRTIGITANYSF